MYVCVCAEGGEGDVSLICNTSCVVCVCVEGDGEGVCHVCNTSCVGCVCVCVCVCVEGGWGMGDGKGCVKYVCRVCVCVEGGWEGCVMYVIHVIYQCTVVHIDDSV